MTGGEQIRFRPSQHPDLPEPDFKDYYLTDSRPPETIRRDRAGVPWRSMDDLLNREAAAEAAYWGPEADFYESLLSEHREGGGLFGVDPVMHTVRAGLVALGSVETPAG